MNTRIVTDSTCDLPKHIVAQHAITVIPMSINAGGQTYLDAVDLTRDDFYTRLPHFHPHPTTSAPGPGIFMQIFDRLADEGARAILSIHVAETLSATVNSARIAAEEFSRIPVTVLDSGQLSLGHGFIVEYAAQLAELGKEMHEILSSVRNFMKRTYVFASLNTLEYLRRSGRMNSALAKFGDLLELKPLLHMNLGNAAAHRVRTQKRATARLFEWLAEYSPYEKLAVVHAGVTQEAAALAAEARAFFPPGDVLIEQITPVLGAHLGVGALGFACVSKE